MSLPVIAIVGPTATGKSDLALDLADALSSPGAEIVNADAFQLYRDMDIGTAKVPSGQRRGIAHHQLDVLDVEQDASVAAYQSAARATVDQIAHRGHRAIVVGGSGLYVRALLDDMRFPGTDPEVRAALTERAERHGVDMLYRELEALDPAAAVAIGPANTRRIVRALEVIAITGRPYTATLPRQHYVRPAVQIGLDCARDVLDDRVHARVARMRDLGLDREVRQLAGRLGRTAARAVGYAELLDHFAGGRTATQAWSDIGANTRRLARKQMGWFGRDPRIHWLDAQDPQRVTAALAVVAAADAGGLGESHDLPVRRSLGS